MLQSLINYIYRYPKSRLKLYNSFGGWVAYQSMLHNRDRMKRYAARLPPVQSWNDGQRVYFLTGKNYLYQTLFCIQSLHRVAGERLHITIVDDGSFDAEMIRMVNRLLPGVTLIMEEQVQWYLDQLLPTTQYPYLRAKRLEYPHLRKLTDVHALDGSSWKLVLDSDMLFWQKPDEIFNWLKQPVQPVYMHDCTESYGYSQALMQQLCGMQLPRLLNVGVIGLNSGQIDWCKLDSWIKILEEKEGGSYYLEQALTAMLIGDRPSTVLNRQKYLVNPHITAVAKREGVLHHYVDVSKKAYFNDAWKKVFFNEDA